MAQPSKTTTSTGHNAGSTGVFPPFDKTTFPSQLFWLAIVFVALYVISARIILPRLGGVIAERRNRIANDLDDAAKAKAKAEEASAAYDKALAEARERAQAIARNTRDVINAETEAKRKQLEAELAEKLAKAESTIVATKAKAMNNVEAIASEAAASIVEHLTGSKPAATSLKSAIGTALKG
jgi:F-type H+-transporting ATPase subunit b